MYRTKTGKFTSKSHYHRLRKAYERKKKQQGITVINVDENNNICTDSVRVDRETETERVPSESDIVGVHHDTDYECYDISDSEEDVSDSDSSWDCGRRIVELGVIVENLLKGCVMCGFPLHLVDCVNEKRYGLGSLLYIRCRQSACRYLSPVPTGKRQTLTTGSKSNNPAWDVNTKLALAMIHAGLGEAKVNDFLSTLNIPPVSPTTLKKKERIAGKHVEGVAQETCKSFAEEETVLSRNGNKIVVSTDAGWHTRSSGRSYCSLSGHAAMIGKETGKCVSYATRNKFCRFCNRAERLGIEASDHDCRKNWTGSSKAMEPDMCVSMLKDLESQDIIVDTVIMDDDTTTIARLRSEVNAGLKKISDSNHTVRHFTNRLYSLRQQKKYKQLNPRSISHLGKCFTYAVSQNCGDSEGTKKSIMAIKTHVFGTHELCDRAWCKFLQNPATYKPKNLPYKRYFSGDDFREDFSKIIKEFASESEKLCSLGSTQANESLNNTVASKAPKCTFSAGSESNDFRVAAAVCQKNIGCGYVNEVNGKMLLSPGKFTDQRIGNVDEMRRKRKELAEKPSYKRQRLMKKEKNFSSESCRVTREGTCYESNVNFHQDDSDCNILEIPAPQTAPKSSPLSDGKSYTYVYFDLETTGLERHSDITQIGATCGKETFDIYMIPEKKISTSATCVTGLAMMNHQIIKNGIPVVAVSPKDGLTKFSSWLHQFPNPLLVAHNCRSFDSLVLSFNLQKHGVSSDIEGFCDTLPFFRKNFPGRTSYKQKDLVFDLLQESYDAHDAHADAVILQKLCQSVVRMENPTSTLLENSFSTKFLFDFLHYEKEKKINSESLQPLVDAKVISPHMRAKIASSGLGLRHIELAHTRDTNLGVKHLFLECASDGKPRVTKNSKIVCQVVQYLEQQTSEETTPT